MIRVLCVNVGSADARIYDSLYHLATSQRQKRADRYRFRDDKLRCVTADALLKRALGTDRYQVGKMVRSGDRATSMIPQAEKNPKMKMSLVFRWYLGSSSRLAVRGDADRKFDMQIWCGQSMGAFNLWVRGTPLEQAENRHVGQVAKLLLDSCAYHYMKNLLIRMGAAPESFREDIL